MTEHISPASNLKELTTAVATLPRIVEHTTSMYQLASTCEAIARTTKKTEKARILAHYFRSRPIDEAVLAAVYLSGRVFPGYEERTLNLGATLLWQVVAKLSGKSDDVLTAAYRKYGDLGSAAADVLHGAGPDAPALALAEVAHCFREIANARGPAAKMKFVSDLLARATPLEAKYLIKIITGDLRIGLRESLVEEAIAKAYDVPLSPVQRANMLLGDIGETLRLAAQNRLQEAKMRMFHAIGFMLASPVESAVEACAYFGNAAVEDKYDGIRAQAHASAGEVRLFSRTLDDVTESFPELIEPLQHFTSDVILDGEIVAWQRSKHGEELGRALPFFELQKRLGRKNVSPEMLREVPVAYVAFDVLHVNGELLIDRPLRERTAILDSLFVTAAESAPGDQQPGLAPITDPQGRLVFEPAIAAEEPVTQAPVIRAPVLRAQSAEHLEHLFELAQARGNEGLMIKDIESPYTPGRRGRFWLKLKREMATLDVVVTAVEFGHGKRAGVLSDYTFAVRDGDRFVNIGKAYSGLTDVEIAEMTRWFFEHTVADLGFRREVEPRIVLEVAFNAIMRSDRHEGGYALRFPRIVRIRQDKGPEDANTLDDVHELYQRQRLPTGV